MTDASATGGRARASLSNFRGIAWMALSGIVFVGVTGVVRHLGSDLPAVQAAFVRYLFGLILLIPVYLKLHREWIVRGPLNRRTLGLHSLRGLVHGVAVMLWFYAMARIPIAQVTALGFTAPIFTTIGAALFLGEKFHIRRIGAVLLGFGGALVIIRPGFIEVDIGALAQLTAAPLFAVSFILAKKLTRTESPASIVAYLSIFVTLALLPPAIAVWRPPTLEELVVLFGTAGLATLGHYPLTRAFRSAEITVTQPVGFLQLVWASLLGMTVFGEALDPFVFLGGGIIVAAATYISHREAQAARRLVTPPAEAMKG